MRSRECKEGARKMQFCRPSHSSHSWFPAAYSSTPGKHSAYVFFGCLDSTCIGVCFACVHMNVCLQIAHTSDCAWALDFS